VIWDIVFGVPIVGLIAFAVVLRYGLAFPRFGRWLEKSWGLRSPVKGPVYTIFGLGAGRRLVRLVRQTGTERLMSHLSGPQMSGGPVARSHRIDGTILAAGRLPNDRSFAILGTPGEFGHSDAFELAAEVQGTGKPGLDGGISSFVPEQFPGILAYAVAMRSAPEPYALVYGLLRDANDEVVARNGAALRTFERRPIPAGLSTGSVLVYLPSASVPDEIEVRSPTGETLMLRRPDAALMERCPPGASGTVIVVPDGN
jgi:hypothetical protein